ncbi:hypothetical protein NQ314_020311 [Rhamnusium bicolor]|uniref:Uncharacterized protein n=1 Tax=Rhamnusium bicolor TaxID=1586634 RepID=A0AAV8WM33_9CUCU|nr:hypothetical protein NQ314_020311 [Rhamnusium bicolor]
MAKLDIKMSHTSAVINGGFYNLAQGTKNQEIAQVGQTYTYYREDDIFQRILPIIPKVDIIMYNSNTIIYLMGNHQLV